MMLRRLLLNKARLGGILAILQFVGLPGLCDAAPDKAPAKELNQVICGPRCVQFVLKHFGREESLESLVREMQWPDQSKGSSVRQIEKALESRGVHTRSIQLKNAKTFSPKSPAIVHVSERSDDDVGNIGHFFIVMPGSTAAEAVVWDGLYEIRGERWADFSKKFSGVVVLTSDSPIEDVDAALQLHGSRFTWTQTQCSWMGLVLGTVFLVFLGQRLARGISKGSSLLLHEEKVQ